jgi:EamA domain-containing membrane protein RarD
MIFWLIVGAALGYFFKPQLDVLVGKLIRAIQDERRGV